MKSQAASNEKLSKNKREGAYNETGKSAMEDRNSISIRMHCTRRVRRAKRGGEGAGQVRQPKTSMISAFKK